MKCKKLALSVLVLLSTASGAAWAACSTAAVDTEVSIPPTIVLTTVTVIAGPNETCQWTDENPNNATFASATGVVVPALLVPVNAYVTGKSVATLLTQKKQNLGQCQVTLVTCTSSGFQIDAPADTPLIRVCRVENTTASMSATATCLYTRFL